MNIEEITKELQNWVSEDSERNVYFVAVQHPRDLSKIGHKVFSSGDMRAVAATMVASSIGNESFMGDTALLMEAMQHIIHLSPEEIIGNPEDKKTNTKAS